MRERSLRGQILPFLAVVVLVAGGLIVVVAVRQPNFLNITSLRGLLESLAPILLLALGHLSLDPA